MSPHLFDQTGCTLAQNCPNGRDGVATQDSCHMHRTGDLTADRTEQVIGGIPTW